MCTFHLKNHPNIAFKYNYLDGNFHDFLFTLDSVVELFGKYFTNMSDKQLTISLQKTSPAPMCIRQANLIYLNTEYNLYAQAAYQFSHELCHFMIPKDVTAELRWFEESICQLASIFFLVGLCDHWKKHSINIYTNDGKLYADAFFDYAIKDAAGETLINIHNPKEFQSLILDCEQRAKNKYIANLLLPVFQKYPLTWHAVPYLCNVTFNPNSSQINAFHKALEQWIEISPCESHIGLEAIQNIFFPQESC